MKNYKLQIVFSLSFLLSSCGGGNSNEPKAFQGANSNFSIQKFNEDLIGNFYLPEMQKVLLSLNTLSEKTKDCSNSFDNKELQSEWKNLSLTYQRLWPLNHATLDPNPEISAEKADRYISGPLSTCGIQLNICLLYTSPSPRDQRGSRMPSSA